MPPEGGIAETSTEAAAALDADAEFAGLLLAGVRIEVVGCALLEAIAAAQLCADENAQRRQRPYRQRTR